MRGSFFRLCLAFGGWRWKISRDEEIPRSCFLFFCLSFLRFTPAFVCARCATMPKPSLSLPVCVLWRNVGTQRILKRARRKRVCTAQRRRGLLYHFSKTHCFFFFLVVFCSRIRTALAVFLLVAPPLCALIKTCHLEKHGGGGIVKKRKLRSFCRSLPSRTRALSFAAADNAHLRN